MRHKLPSVLGLFLLFAAGCGSLSEEDGGATSGAAISTPAAAPGKTVKPVNVRSDPYDSVGDILSVTEGGRDGIIARAYQVIGRDTLWLAVEAPAGMQVFPSVSAGTDIDTVRGLSVDPDNITIDGSKEDGTTVRVRVDFPADALQSPTQLAQVSVPPQPFSSSLSTTQTVQASTDVSDRAVGAVYAMKSVPPRSNDPWRIVALFQVADGTGDKEKDRILLKFVAGGTSFVLFDPGIIFPVAAADDFDFALSGSDLTIKAKKTGPTFTVKIGPGKYSPETLTVTQTGS